MSILDKAGRLASYRITRTGLLMIIIHRILDPRSYRDLALIWGLIAALVVVPVGASYLAAGQSSPHCPTEDSCTASYTHGHWTIREVTP